MKKIGILTFHAGLNQGAYLQAFSLMKYLESNGHDVQIINYRDLDERKSEFDYFVRKWSITRYWGLRLKFANFYKYFKFWKAHTDLNLTPKIDHKNYADEVDKFDIIVTGSDEIWNLNNAVNKIDKPWYYFGEKVKKAKLISISPSFNNTLEEDLKTNKAKDLLSKYSFITVRDKHSQRIIKSLLNREVPITLDPTLFYDSDEFFRFKKPRKKPYILIYVNSITSHEKERILEFSREKNINTVSISYPCFWADKNHIGIGISEWLSYFRFASYVVTNSYHGFIYTVKYQKPSWIIRNKVKSNKLNGLIKQLNIHLPKDDVKTVSDLEKVMIETQSNFEQAEEQILKQKNSNDLLFNELFNSND